MPETPLPSQVDLFADWGPETLRKLTDDNIRDWTNVVPWPVLELVKRYLAGQYVDRDDFDYEAAHDRFDAIVAEAESADLILVDKIVGNLHSILDAVLGDTDNE